MKKSKRNRVMNHFVAQALKYGVGVRIGGGVQYFRYRGTLVRG